MNQESPYNYLFEPCSDEIDLTNIPVPVPTSPLPAKLTTLLQYEQRKLYDYSYAVRRSINPYSLMKYIPTSKQQLELMKMKEMNDSNKKLTIEPYVPSSSSLSTRAAATTKTTKMTSYQRGNKTPQPRELARTNVDCSKFTTVVNDAETIRRRIDRYGFVIIKDVLNADECTDVIDGVWDSMEKITAELNEPLDRNTPSSWGAIKKQWHMRNIYCHHGIVHADFLWKLRQNPNILRVFSLLYGCLPKDLLVSFDGVSMQIPPEQSIESSSSSNSSSRRQKGWYRNNSWYHVDQSYTKIDTQCFQSWVTARDVSRRDSTIGFFVGSHESFNDFGKKFNITNKENFYKLRTKQQMRYYESRYEQIRITCPAGSLVVWDSRLVHSGLEPLRTRTAPNFRTVCFLSYGPRWKAPNRILTKRVELFLKRRATTHWTDVNLRTVPEKKIDKITKLETSPLETEMLKSLVGYPQ